MLFSKKSKKKQLVAYANGTIVPLEELPDPVFSKKILGNGMAILPTDGKLVAPADGVVSDVTESKHAYCITTADGVELLIHFGLDTVKLNGEGFTPLVQNGETIHTGQLLAEADLELIRSKGCSLYCPLVVTNVEKEEYASAETGRAKAGETPIVTFK